MTSISTNADGPHDAASRNIDLTAVPTKYNYQATRKFATNTNRTDGA